MNTKSRYVQYLTSKFGESKTSWINLISDQLFSESQVTLPRSVLTEVQNEINQYTELQNWTRNKKSEYYPTDLIKPSNYSACTSYDFHLKIEDGKLSSELIEINTNAAFLALGLQLYQMLGLPTGTDFNESSLINMFKTESELCGMETLSSIDIIDEKPTEQKLYVEFLVFQNLFRQHGFQSEIFDISEISKISTDTLVYNRSTDFYLQSESHRLLKEKFNSRKIHLSPHPWEYYVLADKQRLFEWNEQTEIPKPKSLLKIYDLGASDKETIWSQRKSLFFKPKNSFGSKQAYKGASISRRVFDEFYGPEFIAQQYSRASEVTIDQENFKYDLRCYAYQGKLQLIMARLYQGQTTNLRTPGGGFAAVIFN